VKTRLVALLLAAALPALPANSESVVLDVPTMDCGLCPITVRRALEKVPGVEKAKVEFERKSATVTFDPAKVEVSALVKATTEAGYPSSVRKSPK